MSFLKNKIVIALISITVAVFILIGVINVTGGSSSPVVGVVTTIFSPVQKVVSSVTSAVDNFTVFIWEMHSYKNENERLVGEINELKKQNRSVEDYKAENDRLKELLNLKENINDYETIAAQIISYEPNNWYETIVIDRGTKSGVNVEDVVINGSGVVGQITEVGSNWARVSAIINIDNALGVKVIRTGDIAIVEGDISLIKSGLCKMDFISNNSSIIVGDMVETSGLGGVYPAGLLVGKIKEIKSDSTGTLQYAVIEPAVDFNNLNETLVIKSSLN